MKYQISYKCTVDILSDTFYAFPILTLRYRPVGSLRWKRSKQPVDQLAKALNYGGFSSTLPLYMYDLSKRVEYFDKALKEKFNNNMDDYVKRVAYTEILENRATKEHNDWINSTIDSWTNDNWKYLEVDIPD